LISKDKIDAAQKSEDKYSTLNTVIIMLNTLLIITAVGCIFLFRNRKIQLLITRLLLLIGSCLIAFLFFNAEQGMELFNGSKHSSVFMAGVYLPIISLLLFYLAGNRIQKDEKLVRDADRLR
jgi:flagellar basal body-associated protein FliL